MLDFFVQHKSSWKQEVLAGSTSGVYLFLELMILAPLLSIGLSKVTLALGVVLLVTSLFVTAKGMVYGVSRATIIFITFFYDQIGPTHLFLIVVFSGVIQVLIGQFKLGKFIRLVPRSVYLGFLNGVSVLVLLYLVKTYSERWLEETDIVLEASIFLVTTLLVLFLPKISKGFPSVLSVVILGIALLFLEPNVLSLGTTSSNELTSVSFWQEYSLNIIDFVEVILPFSVLLGVMNLIESLMAAMLVEELTEDRANGNKESKLLGVANVISGLMLSVPFVCSVTGSSINIKSGGRTWLSGMTTGVVLLMMSFVSIDLSSFSLSVFLGIQFTIFMGVFRWTGIRYFDKIPIRDTVTIVVVSGVTILTEIPAVVVVLGVITSALGFAWYNAVQIRVISIINSEGDREYKVRGLLFFASFNHFLDKFVFDDDSKLIVIDFEEARIVDHSGIEAIHKVVSYFQEEGKQVVLKSLSRDSRFLLKNYDLGELVQIKEANSDPVYKIVTDKVIEKYE